MCKKISFYEINIKDMFMKIIISFIILSTILFSKIITLKDDYITIQYSTLYKSPIIVSYGVCGRDIKAKSIKHRPRFHTDKRIVKPYRVKSNYYIRTGYNRGHLASDATFDFSKNSLNSVYSMANVVPMTPNVNQKSWVKVEELERELAIKYNYVHVVNRVIYPIITKVHKLKKLYIPTTFWKRFDYYKDNKFISECYRYKNITNSIISINSHKENCEKFNKLINPI